LQKLIDGNGHEKSNLFFTSLLDNFRSNFLKTQHFVDAPVNYDRWGLARFKKRRETLVSVIDASGYF